MTNPEAKLKNYPPHKQAIIATRGSELAIWQAKFVQEKLASQGLKSELKVVSTKGDRVQDRFLHEMGGKGVFVRELEHQLIEGNADLAVHSLKDLPVETPKPCEFWALCERHESGDVLLFHPKFDTKRLSNDSVLSKENFVELGLQTVATGSLRRQTLLREAVSSLNVVPLRGNIQTRMDKLRHSDWDALVLAHASFARLGFPKDMEYRILDPRWYIPSPSQGVLVVEGVQDHVLKNFARSCLNSDQTEKIVGMERGVLAALGGDCTMPIGVHFYWKDQDLLGEAVVGTSCGKTARGQVNATSLSCEQAVSTLIDGLKQDHLEDVLKALELAK